MFILDQVFKALTTDWENKEDYYVRSGLIYWGSFNFESNPKAVAIQADAGSLMTPHNDVGRELQLSFEIMGKVGEYISEDNETDNTMISKFLSDASDIVYNLPRHKTNDGNRLFIEVDEKSASFTATYDANLRVQGIIITFTVKI